MLKLILRVNHWDSILLNIVRYKWSLPNAVINISNISDDWILVYSFTKFL